ncbi:MAG: HD-GYP domain-containing protein [Caldilineaceae bacterium]
MGLWAFAAFTAIAKLTSVDLYVNSNSKVSVSSIVVIASVLALGPTAGAFTSLMGRVAATLSTRIFSKQATAKKRLDIFNTGMCVLAALLAGETYVVAGGVPGSPLHWNNTIPVIAAVAVHNVVNLILLIGLVHLETRRSVKQIWQQDFQWSVPIAVIGAVLGGGGLAIGYSVLGVSGLLIFMLPVLATGYSFRLYVKNTGKYIDELERVNGQLDQSNLELLQSLGAVIDAYDVYTYGHSTQVAIYAREIAAEMGLSKQVQDRLMKGGLIHDIGKVGIKDTILSKKDRLTNEEYEILKRHTVIGADIISQMTGLQELVPIVRNHHERWDGRGYPDRLTGEEIPLEARILALADSVDAMLSDREYRSSRTLADAVQEVVRCSGAQFDPNIVTAFLNVVEKHGEAVFTNSARRVDTILASNGMIKPSADMRYLKKSMLSAGALCASNN